MPLQKRCPNRQPYGSFLRRVRESRVPRDKKGVPAFLALCAHPAAAPDDRLAILPRNNGDDPVVPDKFGKLSHNNSQCKIRGIKNEVQRTHRSKNFSEPRPNIPLDLSVSQERDGFVVVSAAVSVVFPKFQKAPSQQPERISAVNRAVVTNRLKLHSKLLQILSHGAWTKKPQMSRNVFSATASHAWRFEIRDHKDKFPFIPEELRNLFKKSRGPSNML